MSEKDIGHEHTGGMAEFKALLREPPLLISISVVFLLFAVFIIWLCHNKWLILTRNSV
jgi:iron(III) transport system permease protein